MPILGTPNIKKLKADRDVDGLAKALRHHSWWGGVGFPFTLNRIGQRITGHLRKHPCKTKYLATDSH